VIEGIRFQNSSGGTVIVNGSDVTLRRVSAYTSGEGNVHVYEIAYTHDVLLEDCAASGKGRNLYLIYESERVTLRRCWGWWMARNSIGDANYVFQVYASVDTLIENNVGSIDPNPSVNNVGAGAFWIADWNDTPACSNNELVGSVYYGFNDWHNLGHSQQSGNTQRNNVMRNVVLVGGGYTGIFQRGGHDFTLENVTLAGDKSWSTFRIDNLYDVNPSASIRNSSLVGSSTGLVVEAGATLTHNHNNLFGFQSPYSGTSRGTGETFINPGYDVSTYGLGAYLFVPPALRGQGANGVDVGAEVLYRSVNGTMTDEPLWPWPMEARICAEMAHLFGDGTNGISVTYESHNTSYDYDGDGQAETYHCTGGIWHTLEGVY
jgi:hypothetical protein